MIGFLNGKVVKRTVQSTMQKILEKWGNVKLNEEKWFTYGIRRYTRGLFADIFNPTVIEKMVIFHNE